MQEAHAAGVAAAREFVKRAEIDEDGFVRDTFGRASLKVGDRSGDFRSALKRLGPDAEVWEGYWCLRLPIRWTHPKSVIVAPVVEVRSWSHSSK